MSRAIHGVRQGFIIVRHATELFPKFADYESFGDTIEDVRAYAGDWYADFDDEWSICPCMISWGVPVETHQKQRAENAGPLFDRTIVGP